MSTDAIRKFAQECRGRMEKATKGPWKRGSTYLAQTCGTYKVRNSDDSGTVAEVITEEREEQGSYDADFIAHSRQDIATLLTLLDAAVEIYTVLDDDTIPQWGEFGCVWNCGSHKNHRDDCTYVKLRFALARFNSCLAGGGAKNGDQNDK